MFGRFFVRQVSKEMERGVAKDSEKGAEILFEKYYTSKQSHQAAHIVQESAKETVFHKLMNNVVEPRIMEGILKPTMTYSSKVDSKVLLDHLPKVNEDQTKKPKP